MIATWSRLPESSFEGLHEILEPADLSAHVVDFDIGVDDLAWALRSRDVSLVDDLIAAMNDDI